MFLIHPSQHLRTQKRCKPIVEDLLSLERETVLKCNICGSGQNAIISDRDRYGFPIRTAMCLNCGLIYLVDRFRNEGYLKFYSEGTYRALVYQFKYKGKPVTVHKRQAEQARYAAKLIDALRGYVTPQRGARLLDVGGSTGMIAREFASRYGFSAFVLDAAPDEVAAAKSLGLNAFVGTIEDWDTEERYDLILLCRTIEHLSDLRGALTKIRGLLHPDGLFYFDAFDFIELCRVTGPPKVVSRIDHCYWISQEVAPPLLRALGFEVVLIHTVLPPEQVGFLAKPCEPSVLRPLSTTWLEQQIRRCREIQFDWQEYGKTTYDLSDWLRKKAYQLKKMATH
jgi:SAM-dependent methyltransferase